jgi:Ca2+:H+ antiporter
MRSHHSIYDDVLRDESHKDDDRNKDLNKAKLTLTESVLALSIALACVSFMAYFLVGEIDYIVNERKVKDA